MTTSGLTALVASPTHVKCGSKMSFVAKSTPFHFLTGGTARCRKPSFRYRRLARRHGHSAWLGIGASQSSSALVVNLSFAYSSVRIKIRPISTLDCEQREIRSFCVATSTMSIMRRAGICTRFVARKTQSTQRPPGHLSMVRGSSGCHRHVRRTADQPLIARDMAV